MVKKVLFIAPIPPPITGHSLVSKILLDDIIKYSEVEIVNLSKDSFKQGITSFKRIFEIFKILFNIFNKQSSCDIIYLTISESLAGNIKDLLIYSVCYRNRKNIVIHLHGGSIKKLLWDKYPLLYKINKFFLKDFKSVIISGKSHLQIFNEIFSSDKIHIIPNFAQDYIFTNTKDIENKFQTVSKKINLLYMSNLIPQKGFLFLLESFLSLPLNIREDYQLNFAGAFDSDINKKNFELKINEFKNITYHGIVNDSLKKNLFNNAHIFCLPTTFFEGQPISILEAYASGCVVITTPQPGILDIFKSENGYIIDLNTSDSLQNILKKIHEDKKNLKDFAFKNFNNASVNYKVENYLLKLNKIFTILS